MRELSRKTFELELRGDLRFERDRRARVASDRVPGRAFVRDEDLGVGKLEAFDLDRAVSTLVASIGERLAHAREILAELRSEDLEVRLHGLLHQALRRVADLDRLHVELILHDLRQL